jgi:hypothetical protein
MKEPDPAERGGRFPQRNPSPSNVDFEAFAARVVEGFEFGEPVVQCALDCGHLTGQSPRGLDGRAQYQRLVEATDTDRDRARSYLADQAVAAPDTTTDGDIPPWEKKS